MVTPTYPGVYVEEVSSGARPITVASTSTAAFIGQAEKGSLSEAKLIFNFTQFQSYYGNFQSSSFLAHSVYQFFNNGGSMAYIIRVAGANTASAELVLSDRADVAAETLTVSAVSAGVWGNDIEIEITNGTVDAENEFNLYVYRGSGEEASLLEVFENLSMVPSAPTFVETVVSSSAVIQVSVNDANPTLAGVQARGASIGGAAPMALTVPETRLRININGDGYQEVDLTDGVGVGVGQVANLNSGANIAAALQFTVRNSIAPLRASTDAAAFNLFVAVIETIDAVDVLVLRSGVSSAGSSVTVARASDAANNATGFLNVGRLDGGRETLGAAITRPPNIRYAIDSARYALGDHSPVAPAGPVIAIAAGSDGDPIINEQPYIDGLNLLDDKQDVSLIAIPGVASPSLFGEAVNYCDNRPLRDCFFIGDMPQDYDTVEEAQGFVGGVSPKNSYGAVYMPWLNMNDPTGVSSQPITVPPSGFVAGMYAKTDARRGVWKAPAGTSAAIAGATGLITNLTDVEQGLLNPTPYHVNVIRQFAASGRVIWGARTVTSDAEWAYIPVRRTAILMRVSIYRGIQWAVFEPNDVPLWQALRLNITSFMMTLYRRGAFQGSTPSEAFFVKVDSETTTQDDINAGIVNIQVGFAALKPAEFVVVQISQKAGQTG
ncbi:phage tail sheath subtilisin-like domain-containing protein [Teredinibacter purpureus]|uniref:phage tail sheath subtilisin-like domain-containing protein n=1 Tax=Teredinibacter purpureus TaxID=2731756 RepID=UPI0005F7D0EA|nr:phage tail sheath subtilisin-like domain-containing protein [Teredinibacter purpureus]